MKGNKPIDPFRVPAEVEYRTQNPRVAKLRDAVGWRQDEFVLLAARHVGKAVQVFEDYKARWPNLSWLQEKLPERMQFGTYKMLKDLAEPEMKQREEEREEETVYAHLDLKSEMGDIPYPLEKEPSVVSNELPPKHKITTPELKTVAALEGMEGSVSHALAKEQPDVTSKPKPRIEEVLGQEQAPAAEKEPPVVSNELPPKPKVATPEEAIRAKLPLYLRELSIEQLEKVVVEEDIIKDLKALKSQDDPLQAQQKEGQERLKDASFEWLKAMNKSEIIEREIGKNTLNVLNSKSVKELKENYAKLEGLIRRQAWKKEEESKSALDTARQNYLLRFRELISQDQEVKAAQDGARKAVLDSKNVSELENNAFNLKKFIGSKQWPSEILKEYFKEAQKLYLLKLRDFNYGLKKNSKKQEISKAEEMVKTPFGPVDIELSDDQQIALKNIEALTPPELKTKQLESKVDGMAQKLKIATRN